MKDGTLFFEKLILVNQGFSFDRHGIMALIIKANREGSYEPVHMHSLTRNFTACTQGSDVDEGSAELNIHVKN